MYWLQQREQELRIHTDKNLIKTQMRILGKINLITYELEKRQAKNIQINNSDNYIINTEHWFSDEN